MIRASGCGSVSRMFVAPRDRSVSSSTTPTALHLTGHGVHVAEQHHGRAVLAVHVLADGVARLVPAGGEAQFAHRLDEEAGDVFLLVRRRRYRQHLLRQVDRVLLGDRFFLGPEHPRAHVRPTAISSDSSSADSTLVASPASAAVTGLSRRPSAIRTRGTPARSASRAATSLSRMPPDTTAGAPVAGTR